MTQPYKGVGRPGVIWAAPAVVFFVVFAAGPLLLVFYLSFSEWDGLGGFPAWNGIDNWRQLWDDEVMRSAVWLSVLLTALTWLVQTPIALLLGVWAAGRQRNRAFLAAVFFLPLLASSVALALLWKSLLDPNFGLITEVGPWIGIESDVLGSPRGAFGAVIWVTAWQFIPFHTLIYQGGARAIPRSLYDAASIDGAGTVRQFFAITLPQLRNTVVTSSVLMVVGALTYFDTVLILTEGGPGTDTTIVPYHMYESGFQAHDMGFASAIATALVVVATTLSLLLVRLTGFSKMRSTREGL